jgi:glycosyltransferase involved in cell wall biosynthesis
VTPDDVTGVHVLYVHHRPELSGAAIALASLLGELDRARFRPHVLSPAGPAAELFRSRGAVVHEGTVAGFTHIWASTYGGRRWLVFARELMRLPLHLASVRGLLRSHAFALVHLNDSPLVPAAVVARRAGLPVVWHLRSALGGGGTDLRARLVRWTVSRLATAPVAINRDVAASFGIAAEIVYDPVDLERFRPLARREARARLGIDEATAVVSYFGYLYPAKGFRELIRAAALVRERGVQAVWLLVGGAVRPSTYLATRTGRLLIAARLTHDYEREARELARSLGLGEDVRLLPRADDTAPIVAASDVVAVPSQGPEIGLPALEAAAAGVPVVASGTRDGGGVVLPGTTGVLAARTPAALADAVAGLLADPGRRCRIGEAARAHAEANFDAAVSARRLEELYDRLLAGVGRGDRRREAEAAFPADVRT